MSNILDRRQSDGNKALPNRQKFLKRYKKQIKKAVDKAINKRNLKDDGPLDINIGTTKEPTFQQDPHEGKHEHVGAGNRKYSKGQKINKPAGGRSQGGASSSGEGEDEFTFSLTKEEYLSIYFSDMALPDYIKTSIIGSDKFKIKRHGYSKIGNPPKLNIKKTWEQAIARRISTKSQGKKPAFLDETDIRYNYYMPEPDPVKKAVLFFVLDTSGSMGEHEKDLAKRFMMLLYVFISTQYDSVDIRFIRHTHEAAEVTEEEFFYSRANGGTLVSKAFDLIDEIMQEEYDVDRVNVYIAQCSDGDNWEEDDAILLDLLREKILPKVQYFAYVETTSIEEIMYTRQFNGHSLYKLYEELESESHKFHRKRAVSREDIFPVFAELFRREK